MVDFGTDTSCTTSMRTGVLVSGLRLVAEAVYRRLTTPRGTLQGGDDEANYGLDLVGLLGSVATDSDAAALPGQITSELLKDERIADVTVTVSSVKAGPAVSWTISIGVATALGPFTLVLGVSGVTVALLGFTPGS